MNDYSNDPVIAALVGDAPMPRPDPGMAKSAAPFHGPSLSMPLHPAVSELLEAIADLRAGEVVERTAERDGRGSIIRTIERKRGPRDAIARGEAAMVRLNGDWDSDLSKQDRLQGLAAELTFCEAARPFVDAGSVKKLDGIAHKIVRGLAAQGIDLKPSYRHDSEGA